jgi:anti-anti-sigma factor
MKRHVTKWGHAECPQARLQHGNLELRDRLPVLHRSDKVNIVLNLRDVSEIDSAGLRTLVVSLARLRKSRRRTMLIRTAPFISIRLLE